MHRLREIQGEMAELLHEAEQIVSGEKKDHRMVYERMLAYWHPAIAMALSDEHNYLGSGGATMEEACLALESDEEDEDEEYEEDEE